MYYLILIIAFLGVILGQVLAWIAWDEVKQYEFIIKSIQMLSAISILGLLLSNTEHYILPLLIFVIWLGLYLYKPVLSYPVLPVFLYFAYQSNTVAYVASCIMLYGFAQGSLYAHSLGKKIGCSTLGTLKVANTHFVFLVVGALLGIIL
ncbi:hypothetical protein ACFL1B_05075 [Nanoarchaeota archaeon]